MIINELLKEDPQPGDSIDIQFGDILIETVIDEVTDDGIVVKLDETAMSMIVDSKKKLLESIKIGEYAGSSSDDDDYDDDDMSASSAMVPTSVIPEPINLPEPIKSPTPKFISALPGSDTKAVRVMPTAAEIAKLNKLDPNKLQIGTKIKLPDGSSYTIKSGDTLSGVISKYNRQKETLPPDQQPKTQITNKPNTNITQPQRDAATSKVNLPSTDDSELSNTLDKFAAAETGMNYDLSYRAPSIKGPKGPDGKPTVIKPIKPEDMFGKPLTQLTLSQVQQFQAARNKQVPNGAAVGAYQFIPSTLNGLISQLKIDPETTVFDAETQRKLAKQLTVSNRRLLSRNGITPDAANTYMAHYVGGGGALAVHRAAQTNPDANVGEILAKLELRKQKKDENDPEELKKQFNAITKHNPELKTVKAGDFYSILQNRLNEKYAAAMASKKGPTKIVAAKPTKVSEAEYQGRDVPLGKPMAGDVKKSKVYVKGPKGNVVKVNFGDKNMKINISNPNRRKSFRARHNCDNPGPRWKARYWSCRAW